MYTSAAECCGGNEPISSFDVRTSVFINIILEPKKQQQFLDLQAFLCNVQECKAAFEHVKYTALQDWFQTIVYTNLTIDIPLAFI